MQDKIDAKQFLRDELGIWQINQRGKFRTWTCLSCLLSQFYNIYCMDPEGDEKFAKEIEQSNFELVPKQVINR